MPRASDPERDERITMEVIVDCYDEYEVMVGWHTYLEDNLSFPFVAECVKKRLDSPLKAKQTYTVQGLADIDDCIDEDGILALVEFDDEALAVPLAQLMPK